MNKISCKVSNAILALWINGKNSDGRTIYNYDIVLPSGFSYFGDDIKSGCQGGNLKEGMENLLGFLLAAGESFNYAERMGKDGMEGENSDLFPREITEWASNNCDELTVVWLEIKESEK